MAQLDSAKNMSPQPNDLLLVESNADGSRGAATVQQVITRQRPDEVRWDDLRFPANDVNPGVANAPDWTLVAPGTTGTGDFGQLYVLEFNQNTEEEVYLNVQLPHAWKEGSEIRPHIHWINHTQSVGDVVWGIEYAIANVNGYFPADTTKQSVVATCAPWVDGEIKHQIDSFGGIDMTGFEISCMLLIRLYREADNPLDTADDDVGLLEFDIHIQYDSDGSEEEFVKS